jgi:hypothetical protein
MSTYAEVAAPSRNIPECLRGLEQTHFVFPIGPSLRSLHVAAQAALVDARPSPLGALANCGRLILCLHSEAAGFEDVYLTFAGADCQNPDFAAMLRWLQAKLSCGRGASVSMGVAGTKVVAAIASRMAPPERECVVVPGTEEGFLAPVSVRKLRGVVQIDACALAERGITTIGQLRQIPKPVLSSAFGEAPGRALWEAARGRDAKEVGQWRLTSLLRPRLAPCAVTGQPGWMQRLLLGLTTRLEALDRALDRILTIQEEVPPRTTRLS